MRTIVLATAAIWRHISFISIICFLAILFFCERVCVWLFFFLLFNFNVTRFFLCIYKQMRVILPFCFSTGQIAGNFSSHHLCRSSCHFFFILFFFSLFFHLSKLVDIFDHPVLRKNNQSVRLILHTVCVCAFAYYVLCYH